MSMYRAKPVEALQYTYDASAAVAALLKKAAPNAIWDSTGSREQGFMKFTPGVVTVGRGGPQQLYLRDGDWLVVLPGGPQVVTDAEFRANYEEVTPGS